MPDDVNKLLIWPHERQMRYNVNKESSLICVVQPHQKRWRTNAQENYKNS